MRCLCDFTSYLVFITIMVIWLMCHQLRILWPIYSWNRWFFLYLRQRLYKLCVLGNLRLFRFLVTWIIYLLNLLFCFAYHLLDFLLERSSNILLLYLLFDLLFSLSFSYNRLGIMNFINSSLQIQYLGSKLVLTSWSPIKSLIHNIDHSAL